MRRVLRRAILAGCLSALVLACGWPEPRPTATPLPTPGPAPAVGTPIPASAPVLPESGPTPTMMPGSRAPTAPRAILQRQVWLLEAPRPTARRVMPVGQIAAGVDVAIVEANGDWVRIDAIDFTGWTTSDAIEYVR